MPTKLSKNEMAVLRGYVNDAWESELHDALGGLFDDFSRWADFKRSSQTKSKRSGGSKTLADEATQLQAVQWAGDFSYDLNYVRVGARDLIQQCQSFGHELLASTAAERLFEERGGRPEGQG